MELACAIFAYTHQDLIGKYLDNSMYEVVHKYYASRQEYAKIFDRIQTEVSQAKERISDYAFLVDFTRFISNFFSSNAVA